MFEGQSPDNYEQKCLCVLVLDVSGSMSGQPIEELNRGLQDFKREVLLDTVASQRLEVSIVTFDSSARCIQEPSLIENFEMPKLYPTGSTKLVDGVHKALEIVESRKQWYKSTGQNYYRPIVVLFTDGEPDAEQDVIGLSADVRNAVANKKFIFWAIGTSGYNHNKLAQISPIETPPIPLNGLAFSEFFKWLSNSIGIITKSKEGEMLALPAPSGWAQIQM
jgi:uncharacterized protein YegL